MPIYAYRCNTCGFQKDVLQKFSDAPLTVCPSCEKDTFGKQVTAPAFQLKGTGWYVTDFRDNGRKPAGNAASGGTDAGKAAGNDSGNGDSASAGAAASGDKASAGSSSPAGASTGGASPESASAGGAA